MKHKFESILYVEDERNIQKEFEPFLKRFCERLFIANNGEKGLSIFKKHKPKLVISDIKMPIKDGLLMSEEIKNIDNETFIILLTAYNELDFLHKAIEIQVDGYILKPIDFDIFEKKTTNLLENINLKKEIEEKESLLLQQSKMASMGEMLGNIAHQWRQPLNVVSTLASGIIIDCELEEKIDTKLLKNHMETVLEQTQYLSNTIDDFRNFFKPHFELEPFSLKEFTEKCIKLVQAAFDENTIEAIKEIEENVKTYGYTNLLSQALINILNNSKDALKKAESLNKKLVFIFSAKEDNSNNIVFTIKDNAGGIPEDIINRVFEPYFTTKKSDEGTGLGLYITLTIITKNLKGIIKVENEIFNFEGIEYKGAKFTIKLPILETKD